MQASSLRVLPRLLLAIILLGLGARVLFMVVGVAAYYHSPDLFCLNGDSSSYTQSFENLWRVGRYTFDLQVPEASFGRLPGYPFFYGVHRLVFGAALAPVATAWSQLLLDTAAIWLVFGILSRMAPAVRWAPYLGAFLYATYPFVMVWVPVIGTESLSTDLTLLWFYLLLGWRPTLAYSLGTGVLVAANLFVREYMGSLLPITLLWVVVKAMPQGWPLAWRHAALVAAGFGVLYIGWPVRNYVLAHRLMLLKPQAAGYINQTPDVDEFYKWVHCWDANENPWLDSVLIGQGPVHFPESACSTPAEAAQAQTLVLLARHCGSGFYAVRGSQPADSVYRRYRTDNCNAAISTGFQQLRQQFAAEHPWRYWFDVPVQNLRKAFFKSRLVPPQALYPHAPPRSAGLLGLIFGYRTALLLLGWVGLFASLRRYPALWLVLAVSGFQYVYICFFYRGLEMRYLLQADALLILPAALWLGRGLAQVRNWRPGALASSTAN
ncbi:hypothetical protein [Hymenobacter rubidus]|uniref:hypothetical protein n=1 Tax=Hymenobacter rubidus TaxID=1441626 RepID=UPI00191EB92B|nr:hypothetical protein [Hymenobacter rubidus]